ncbi:hypothetical protein QOZ80_2AG0129400 [Eleusine coracana subsp. coracana]|nr:hypothetical protein QOZ80_2AG0129400 [Eleusine coracana subsp. coracana]
MAVSGGGERAVAVSGEGRPPSPLDSLEYPCTRRLRLRRLLAYLRGYSHWGAYDAVNRATREIFHVSHLVNHVKAGQWGEALTYVLGFVNLYTSGHEAGSLLRFIDDFKAICSFADGGTLGASYLRSWFLQIYNQPVLSKYPYFATLVADFLFNRPDHARAFLDWQLVRNKAAAIVKEMASKTPELKDKLHLPRGRNSLYYVVNVGSSFRPRRPIKKLGRKQSTDDLAQFYLQAKKRLPSSTQGAIPDYSGGPKPNWHVGAD